MQYIFVIFRIYAMFFLMIVLAHKLVGCDSNITDCSNSIFAAVCRTTSIPYFFSITFRIGVYVHSIYVHSIYVHTVHYKIRVHYFAE